MLLDHAHKPRRHGTVTIEFSLMFFLLVLFMFAIFEYGRLLMIRHLVNNAAREGARTETTGDQCSREGRGTSGDRGAIHGRSVARPRPRARGKRQKAPTLR